MNDNKPIPETLWLEEEAKKLTSPANFEQLPSLKLTPNVVTEILIDFTPAISCRIQLPINPVSKCPDVHDWPGPSPKD